MAAITEAIAARGGQIELADIGPGQDFFDRPDPRTARVVARWAPTTDSREKDQP